MSEVDLPSPEHTAFTVLNPPEGDLLEQLESVLNSCYCFIYLWSFSVSIGLKNTEKWADETAVSQFLMLKKKASLVLLIKKLNTNLSA